MATSFLGNVGTYTPPNTDTQTTGAYNASPAPRSGQGAYGLVPGDVSVPDPYGDLSKVYPNLGATNQQLSGNIMSELQGQLSPETVNQIKDAAATFGVTSGMPGSGLVNYSALRNYGLTKEGLMQQGAKDYNATVPTVSATQTVSPALQSQIAEQNAVWNSAPDPAAAAAQQQAQFDEYLNKLMSFNPAGATGVSNKAPEIPFAPGQIKFGSTTVYPSVPLGW